MSNVPEQTAISTSSGKAPLPFAIRAARTSWQVWVLLLLSVVFANQFGLGLLVELIAPLGLLFGLGAGIAALCGIPRHGTRGILAPALVGILLNGLQSAIFVTNFLAAYQRSQ